MMPARGRERYQDRWLIGRRKRDAGLSPIDAKDPKALLRPSGPVLSGMQAGLDGVTTEDG